ncbi:hypothetical protein BJ912DRAFT_954292 [Pholiota molesta]|nr:hypothetical protein BJ912DRAFT_954292 [Pholiota molesta]
MAVNSASARLISSATLILRVLKPKSTKPVSRPRPTLLLKYRFRKTYRHAALDASLTKARVAGEARALLKCLRSGVNVPGIWMVDAAEGLLGIEWIDGRSVNISSERGGGRRRRRRSTGRGSGADACALWDIGGYADESHWRRDCQNAPADIIHGDLTTSNMMLRDPLSFSPLDPTVPTEIVLIDFGLSYHSTLVEDKAVDLYVLERAFASTHPDSEPMFAGVLSAYEKQLGKEWPALRRRLDDVRLRGRKRSMVG